MLKIEYNEGSNNFAVTRDGYAVRQFKTRVEAESFLAEQGDNMKRGDVVEWQGEQYQILDLDSQDARIISLENLKNNLSISEVVTLTELTPVVAETVEQVEGSEKEARELSPEKATRKLLQLVQESPTFDDFKVKLAGNRWWYLGDPMPEPFRTWTWAEFQTFFQENKKI